MVVEHYRDGDPGPVYRRFREHGRLLPEGVTYVSSWVTEDLAHCYQVMQAGDRPALDEWIANWADLAEFDVIPVVTSAEAARRADG